MIKIYSYLVLFCILSQFQNSILACSYIYDPPTKFDSTEYIFIGRIVGYTGSLFSDSLYRSYQGLIVEIVDPIYLPKTPGGKFEIIPFSLGPACELITISEKTFRKEYPLGVELRIVGKETKLLNRNISSGNIRLDVSPYNMFHISRNFREPDILHSTNSSIYDYQYACVHRNACEDSNQTFINFLSECDTEKGQELRISYHLQHHFELRKDLFRLAIAASDSDKAEIIKRLFSFGVYSKKDFLEIINTNIKNEEVKNLLLSLNPRQFEYPPADVSLHPEIPDSLSSPWIQTNGPYGGPVFCLALKEKPDESLILFAGTRNNGVFRSTNNGKNWSETNKGLTNPYINTLFINEDYIYAGTESGAFRSSDDGDNWVAINTGFEIKKSFRVYAFASSEKYLFAGSGGSGVFRSSDSGKNWIAVSSGITNLLINCLLSFEKYLFAGTYGGIFVSTDEGDNWKAVNEGLPKRFYKNVNSLKLYINTIHLSGNKIFIGTEENGIFSSTNFGTTWDPVDLELKNTRVHSITGNPANLIASTSKGIYRSTNNGLDWYLLYKNYSRFIHTSIAVNDSIIYTGNYGVHFTADYGKNWHNINEGLNNSYISELTVNGDNLIAKIYTEGIFAWTDSGTSWTCLSDNLPLDEFIRITSDNKNIFVASHDGVYHSSDEGESWKRVLEDNNVRKIFLNNDYLFVFVSRYLVRSSNCGESWDTTLTNVRVKFFTTDGKEIFVGNEKEIFCSNDDGSTWNNVSINKNCRITSLAVSEDKLYMVAGELGIAMSSDKGENWIFFDNEFKYYGFSNITTYHNYLFATANRLGVFISANDGEDWIPFNFGLTDLHISSLAIINNILYAGTNSGVWEHKLY